MFLSQIILLTNYCNHLKRCPKRFEILAGNCEKNNSLLLILPLKKPNKIKFSLTVNLWEA